MTELQPYPNARAVEAAIRDAARKAHGLDPSISVSERIRQEHFRRLLCRVFSEGEDSEWLLKGGTGILARVPSARATRDIDLFGSGFTLDQALEDLRRLAAVDLGDHFRFVYAGHSGTLGGDAQPYTDGYRVSFDVYVGAQKRSGLNVDLAVGAGLTAVVSWQPPANGLELPRLVSHDYRLYPVVDQIADKVCATMMLYSGKPSSREKDLIDLVVLATTQTMTGTELNSAIQAESRRRGLAHFDHFVVPGVWGAAYARMARDVPCCEEFRTVQAAGELMAKFIDPALSNRLQGMRWSPGERSWIRDDTAPRTGTRPQGLGASSEQSGVFDGKGGE